MPTQPDDTDVLDVIALDRDEHAVALAEDVHDVDHSPLLFHTTPRAGESLGSWLLRLAHANAYQSVGEFLASHRTAHPASLRKISDMPRDASMTIERIVVECGLRRFDARKLLLTDDLLAFTQHERRGTFTWVIDAGMPHSVCPECFTTAGANPHWQKLWRLSTTTHCSEHDCLLIDRCPECQTPYGIDLTRTTALDECVKCGLGISTPERNASVDRVPKTRFGGEAIKANGAIRFPIGDVEPWAWWSGMTRLLNFISRPIFARALLDHDIPEHFAIGLSHLARGDNKKVRFATREPAQRARMIGFIEWLLSPWPDRFLSILPTAVPDWCHRLNGESSPPWLAQLCIEHRPPPVPMQRALKFKP